MAWAHLRWCRALCAAPPTARRSGGRHPRGALRHLQRAPVTTGGRLQLPERGRLDPGTLGISCAHRAGPQPLGQLLWEPPQGRRMRRRWIDPAAQGLALSSPPPRARCSRSAAAALRQFAALRQYAAAAPLLLDSHRVLDGPLRGRGQHRAGSLLRAGADRGCGLKALPADLWPGACQTAGPNTPALARATAPGAGWDISS